MVRAKKAKITESIFQGLGGFVGGGGVYWGKVWAVGGGWRGLGRRARFVQHPGSPVGDVEVVEGARRRGIARRKWDSFRGVGGKFWRTVGPGLKGINGKTKVKTVVKQFAKDRYLGIIEFKQENREHEEGMKLTGRQNVEKNKIDRLMFFGKNT